MAWQEYKYKSQKTIIGREELDPPESQIQSAQSNQAPTSAAQALGLNSDGDEVFYNISGEKKRLANSPPEKTAPLKQGILAENFPPLPPRQQGAVRKIADREIRKNKKGV